MRPSTFLALPAELRHEIYKHLFQDSYCFIQILRHNVHINHSPSIPSPTPLLLTCRQVSQEVQAMLYNVTLFNIHFHAVHIPLMSPSNPTSILSSSDTILTNLPNDQPQMKLPTRITRHLRQIQRLSLDIWVESGANPRTIAQNFDAFRRSLGFSPTTTTHDHQRALTELKIRIRLRPEWLAVIEERLPAAEEADAVVREAVGLRTWTRRWGLDVDAGFGRLMSAEGWGRADAVGMGR